MASLLVGYRLIVREHTDPRFDLALVYFSMGMLCLARHQCIPDDRQESGGQQSVPNTTPATTITTASRIDLDQLRIDAGAGSFVVAEFAGLWVG